MLLSVVEAAFFVKSTQDIWSDEERENIVAWMATAYPHGDVVPGTNGLQKIRTPVEGKGKRGGARVIYFVKHADGQVWLLAAHKKSERESFSKPFLRALKEHLP